MDKIDELLAAMRAHKTRVVLSGTGNYANVVTEALRRDERLMYYISGYSFMPVGFGFGSTKLQVELSYNNTDTPISDVHVVTDDNQLFALLSRYLGDYKAKLVVCADRRFAVDRLFSRFMEMNAPFYPNFTNVGISTMGLDGFMSLVYVLDFKYRIGKVKLAMMEKEMDREVDRLAALLFPTGMPEQAKVLLAHNYLASTVRYVDKERASNLERSYLQSAYGALIKHGCVCQGYAEAFKRLMDAAGVPCDVVTGSTNTVRDAGHAWNIVKLNGGRDNYHIDVTWDAADPNRISYDYFGLSDSRISLGRNWNRHYNARCNSSTNLLAVARAYVTSNRDALLRRGIPREVLN